MPRSKGSNAAIWTAVIAAVATITAAVIAKLPANNKESARVSGYVRDLDENGIAGVDVYLEIGGPALQTKTKTNGHFDFSSIRADHDDLELRAEKDGYSKFSTIVKLSTKPQVIMNLKPIEKQASPQQPQQSKPAQASAPVLSPNEIEQLKAAGYEATPVGNSLYLITESYFRRTLDLSAACEARKLLSGATLDKVNADRRPLIDPLTGQQLPGGIVPVNRRSPEIFESIYNQRSRNCPER